MKIVIDTNIVFSLLLKENSHLRRLLWDQNNQIYCPNFLFYEIFKHKEKLLSFSKKSKVDLEGTLLEIIERIEFVRSEFVSKETRLKAHILCRDTDPSDTPFVALTLELDASLLTGDKALKDALIKKGFSRFMEFPK